MAAHKAIRSKSPSQPNPHVKSMLFEDLRCLNRGYGMAMAALYRLQRPAIFPRACLADYRNRTDALRALANRDLLGLLAGREGQDAERLGRLTTKRKRAS